MQIDTLILADYVLPMTAEPTVLSQHAIAIKGGKIVAVVPQAQAEHFQATSRVALPGQIVMPGLINLHGHSAMTLLRGLADDLALMDWLNHHIWPAEGQHVDLAFVYDGTLLAMAEMLKGGTTTINDMYFFHAAVAKAGLRMGMRTFVGCSILEFPTNYAANANAYIDQALATQTAFYGESLIQFVLAPHAPYTVSDETFKRVRALSEQHDMLVHCHIHETADEVAGSMTEYGMRPLARLHGLGLLNERLIAAHMVHLNEAELALSAQTRLSIAHNPASNMKLASGFAPTQALLDLGVNVGLGTDGAASNNKLDMFAEMRLGALIAKGSTGNPTALKAYDALKMATVAGAKALHIDDKVGTIAVGMQADLIAVDLDCVETAPLFDPISHLVYAADRSQVSHTWVDGRLLVANGALTQIDEAQLRQTAAQWRAKISHNA